MSLIDRDVKRGAVDVRMRETRWSRTTMLTGIAFAVLFVAGMVVGRDTPDSNAVDTEWTSWFDDSGNRAMQLTSMALLVVSSLLFVVFLTGLCHRMRTTRADNEGPTQVAWGAGLLFAGAIAVGGVTMNAVSASIELGDIPIPSAELLRVIEQLGFGMSLVAAPLFAALAVAAVSLAARPVMLLPRWLVIAGFVAAVLLVFSAMYLPLLALPLWVLAVALYVGRHPVSVLEVSTS
jgi:hypothetical protein